MLLSGPTQPCFGLPTGEGDGVIGNTMGAATVGGAGAWKWATDSACPRLFSS